MAASTRKASAHARGLGWRHRQQAERLKRQHIDGTPCWWCGEPMYLSQGLAADHTIARAMGGTMADRLLHGPCNSQRGDGSRDDMRPAVTGRQRELDERAKYGTCVMEWP